MSDDRDSDLRLKLDPASRQRLEMVQKKINAPTFVEVVRRALHLLDIVVLSEATVILRDKNDGTEKEIVIL